MADIHLQEESFKRAEKARLRNKVEERKLKHELDRKHGLRDTHEYRIQLMSQERRLIEKELDKIRTEIRKAPAPDNNFDISLEEGKGAGGEKNEIQLPARVRGRAMSIHDQSDKFNTPSHLPQPSFRRPSQVAAPPPNQPNPSDNRRPSLMGPASQKAGSRRSSMNPGGASRRPSRVLGQNDQFGATGSRTRRMSTLPAKSHQAGHPASPPTISSGDVTLF